MTRPEIAATPAATPIPPLTPATRAIVVMGVSGSGKTTVGSALAERLGWRFADADAFHPPGNVAKMRSGAPLTDDDRWPWLERLNALVRHSIAKNEPLVLACSALKEAYRARLRTGAPQLSFVHLRGSRQAIEARLRARQHEYMPASLLASQFATLESPADAFDLDIVEPPEQLVERVVAALQRAPRRAS